MLLVLESYWSEDLSDHTSVFPFIDGWARMNGVSVGYRRYHDGKDLSRWLTLFTNHKDYSVCYIAGHGNNGRLTGLHQDINLASLAQATTAVSPGRKPPKGVYFGACEVGSKIENFLCKSGSPIKWAAGYRCSVPWVESTLCDIKFIEYFFHGRIDRLWFQSLQHDIMLLGHGDSLKVTTADSIETVHQWIFEDFPMSKMFGLEVHKKVKKKGEVRIIQSQPATP